MTPPNGFTHFTSSKSYKKWSNRLLDHGHGHAKGLNLQKSKGRKKDQGFTRDLANWMGHDDLAISILFYIYYLVYYDSGF
jgi:hypothetical protein